MDGQNNFLRALSDEEIDKLGLSLADVWMMQTPSGQSIGPFSTEMLKEDSKDRPDFYEECSLYNLVTEEWKSFYSLPEFQRRRPKLVPAQNLIKNESFLVLENGQKTGPLSLEELKEKIEARQVSLNQEISVDEGKSWLKIYEHHAFDRRARAGQEELPFQPSMDVFHHGDETISNKILSLQKDKEDGRVITGLAFIGRGNDRGQRLTVHKASEPKPVEKEKEAHDSVARSPKTIFSKTHKVKATAAAALVAFSLIGYGLNQQFGANESLVGETELKDSRPINNSDRSLKKRTPASANKRTPSSVAPTRAKRYAPPAKRAGSARGKVQQRNQKRNNERISHTYEDFESVDIDDPKVRAELARELAGDYYEDQNKDYEEHDAQGNYPDDEYRDDGYYEEPAQGADAYDDAPSVQGYPAESDPYDTPEPMPEPREELPYEEYGDFE